MKTLHLDHSKEIELDGEFYLVEGYTSWSCENDTNFELDNCELSVVNVYDEKELDKELTQKVIDHFLDTIDTWYEYDLQINSDYEE